jgi:hypothetical protein
MRYPFYTFLNFTSGLPINLMVSVNLVVSIWFGLQNSGWPKFRISTSADANAASSPSRAWRPKYRVSCPNQRECAAHKSAQS